MRLLDREYLQRIEDRAVADILDIALGVADQMMDEDGLVYGDVKITSPAEFVLYYTDLARTGVLDHLAVVNPEHADRLARRFDRDAAASLGATNA